MGCIAKREFLVPCWKANHAAVARCAVTIDGKYAQFEAPQSSTGDNKLAASLRLMDQWSSGDKFQRMVFQSFAPVCALLLIGNNTFVFCYFAIQTPWKTYSIG